MSKVSYLLDIWFITIGLLFLNIKTPRGDSLLVSDGGSDIFWVCETLSSIPLGTLFGA